MGAGYAAHEPRPVPHHVAVDVRAGIAGIVPAEVADVLAVVAAVDLGEQHHVVVDSRAALEVADEAADAVRFLAADLDGTGRVAVDHLAAAGAGGRDAARRSVFVALAADDDLAVDEAVAGDAAIAVFVALDLARQAAGVLFPAVDLSGADHVVRVTVQAPGQDPAGGQALDLGVQDRQVFDIALAEIVAHVAEQAAVFVPHAHDAQVPDGVPLPVEGAEERAVHALLLAVVGQSADGRHIALGVVAGLVGDDCADPLQQGRHVEILGQHVSAAAGRVGGVVAVGVLRLPQP